VRRPDTKVKGLGSLSGPASATAKGKVAGDLPRGSLHSSGSPAGTEGLSEIALIDAISSPSGPPDRGGNAAHPGQHLLPVDYQIPWPGELARALRHSSSENPEGGSSPASGRASSSNWPPAWVGGISS